MSTPLTYLEFVAVFVAAPVVLLLATGTGIDRRRRRAAAGIAVMLALALAYTTPWDNHLIAEGVWWYGDGTVLLRVWNAPVEEYAFVALQTLLAALWLYRRPLPPSDPATESDLAGGEGTGSTTDRADPAGSEGAEPATDPVVPDGGVGSGHADATGDGAVAPDPVVGFLGAGVWLAVAVLGALGLSGETYYLGAILAWAGPVLGLQWAVGGSYLVAVRRHLAWAVGPPVVYLSFVDRLAIGWGLWTISPDHSTGLTVLGLPVEEGAFFLVTTLLVVQGLVLFHWVIETRPYSGLLDR